MVQIMLCVSGSKQLTHQESLTEESEMKGLLTEVWAELGRFTSLQGEPTTYHSSPEGAAEGSGLTGSW